MKLTKRAIFQGSLKTDRDAFLFSEDGYQTVRRSVNRRLLTKELREAIKREFPRSRKVRLYVLSSPEDFEKEYPAI